MNTHSALKIPNSIGIHSIHIGTPESDNASKYYHMKRLSYL